MVRFLIAALFALVSVNAAVARNYGVPLPVKGSEIGITDGDTIHLKSETKGTRLVGFNTGETSKAYAKCDAEIGPGLQAQARLRELLYSPAPATLTFVPCACRPGTEGTDACNWSRTCGVLRVGGRDVADILISEGLAAPLICGKTTCPKTPRPWCESVKARY